MAVTILGGVVEDNGFVELHREDDLDRLCRRQRDEQGCGQPHRLSEGKERTKAVVL